MALGLTRTYNHYWQGIGLFGKHWISNFDYKLTFVDYVSYCYPRPGNPYTCGIGTSGTIYAWRPDGRVIKFIRNTSDGIFYEDKAEPVAYIQRMADDSFVHHTEGQETETYTPTGYISKISKHNVGWTFAYTGGTYPSRVTHTSGRYVEFTWTNGLLTGVRDPAGNNYGYAYTANKFGSGLHRLESSSQPGSPATTTTYHYEFAMDPGALTGKSFNGARYSKFTYDANGYAASSEHNGQEKYTFAYTPGTDGKLTVLQTNPLGKQTTYVYQDGKVTTVTGHPSTHCPETTNALTEYDVNGYPSMTSDFKGNLTSHTYNAKGQLIKKIEAYGTPQARTTVYEWWGPAFDNRLLSKTVSGVSQPISKTVYNYDALANLSRISITNLSSNGTANQVRDTWFSYTYHASSQASAASS